MSCLCGRAFSAYSSRKINIIESYVAQTSKIENTRIAPNVHMMNDTPFESRPAKVHIYVRHITCKKPIIRFAGPLQLTVYTVLFCTHNILQSYEIRFARRLHQINRVERDFYILYWIIVYINCTRLFFPIFISILKLFIYRKRLM